MDIEEHELRYADDAPLRAWRLFRVRPMGESYVLSSPMYHDPEHRPWPNIRSTATCSDGHDAPTPGCRHRPQGPPSEGVDLSLDLDKLDLWE